MNTNDPALLMAFSAIVILMSPIGVLLFYNELPNYAKLIDRFKMTICAFAITAVVWTFWGYTIVFGSDTGGIMGASGFLFPTGITDTGIRHAIIPSVPVIFQMSFAVFAVALLVEFIDAHMKLSSLAVFVVLWLTIVYCPVAHLVWGGGWIASVGVLDFAGGTVVHTNVAVAGFVLVLFNEHQKGPSKKSHSHVHIVVTVIGAMVLWFGWLGITISCQLTEGMLTGLPFAVANVSAAIASLSWGCAEYLRNKEVTFIGFVSGTVAGLVAITPAAGFVNIPAAIIIGFFAGALGFTGITALKNHFGCGIKMNCCCLHGLCSIWGVIGTGIFADPSINASGRGLLYGNPKQLFVQAVSIVATVLFSAFGTILVCYLTKLLDGWHEMEVHGSRPVD